MTKRRKATPVTLTPAQRERLERLWFYYGNYGPQTAPGNHQFIQSLLEHGLDLRPLRTKRTPKSERATPECERAVEAVLAAGAGDTVEADGQGSVLRLVPSPAAGRKAPAPDPELKEFLDDIRRRHFTRRGSEGRIPGGEDAA
jgi:hypothetical protein